MLQIAAAAFTDCSGNGSGPRSGGWLLFVRFRGDRLRVLSFIGCLCADLCCGGFDFCFGFCFERRGLAGILSGFDARLDQELVDFRFFGRRFRVNGYGGGGFGIEGLRLERRLRFQRFLVDFLGSGLLECVLRGGGGCVDLFLFTTVEHGYGRMPVFGKRLARENGKVARWRGGFRGARRL